MNNKTNTTPLAQMSPEELSDEFWSAMRTSHISKNVIHALIQRATQEAREGYVREELLLGCERSHREARAQLAESEHATAKYRDDARRLGYELAEAERKLASAKHEGAREALTAYCMAESGVGHEREGGECSWHLKGNCRVLDFRNRNYPAPTPAASGTEGVSDGMLRASDVAFAVLAASTLPAARANIERLLVALAREAR